MSVCEPNRETRVIGEYDCVVAGAGPAGFAAAIGAARAGAKTLLLEKHGCFGGNLTAGSVLNIRTYHDGDRQIIGGPAGELARRLHEAGAALDSDTGGNHLRHDPEVTKYVLQEMILAAGVAPLLHTLVTGAITEQGRLCGLLVENKSGRGAVRTKMVVDATGDGDVMAYAGTAFEKSEGALQPMTLAAVFGGVSTWPDLLTEQVLQLAQREVDEGTFPVTRPPSLFPLLRTGAYYANATRVPGDCSKAEDLTHGEIEGRRQIFALLQWLQRHAPGFEKAYVQCTAMQVGLRESRRLVGQYVLTSEDVLGYRKPRDTVALGAYAIDIHQVGRGTKMVWLDKGKHYGIPYGCLVPRSTDGLLVAGRCISATHEALGSARAMATCMGMGHAAGVAAALAVRQDRPPRLVSPEHIRAELIEQGAIL